MWTPRRSAHVPSWSIAAARKVSAAARTTVLPSVWSILASLAIEVVFPVPLTPATSQTLGPLSEKRKVRSVRSRMPTSSARRASPNSSGFSFWRRRDWRMASVAATPTSARMRASSTSSQASSSSLPLDMMAPRRSPSTVLLRVRLRRNRVATLGPASGSTAGGAGGTTGGASTTSAGGAAGGGGASTGAGFAWGGAAGGAAGGALGGASGAGLGGAGGGATAVVGRRPTSKAKPTVSASTTAAPAKNRMMNVTGPASSLLQNLQRLDYPHRDGVQRRQFSSGSVRSTRSRPTSPSGEPGRERNRSEITRLAPSERTETP